jgi:hypothetical protein
MPKHMPHAQHCQWATRVHHRKTEICAESEHSGERNLIACFAVGFYSYPHCNHQCNRDSGGTQKNDADNPIAPNP